MTMRLRGGFDIESGELVLIGDADSFKRLASFLRTSESAAIEIDEFTERPVIRPIDVLHLQHDDGAATIGSSDDSATLSGDAASRARLAEKIELFLEHNDLNEPGMHMHVDASSAATGDELLAADSRGLILAGPIPDDQE